MRFIAIFSRPANSNFLAFAFPSQPLHINLVDLSTARFYKESIFTGPSVRSGSLQYKEFACFHKAFSCRVQFSLFHTRRMLKTKDEKDAFAERLKLALKRSARKVSSPTELALQFNLRYKGEPVSPQAAQHWLNGQAQPRLDKMETLAEWLDVSMQWLRFGIAEARPQGGVVRFSKGKRQPQMEPSAGELKVLAQIRGLSAHRRGLVIDLIEQLSLDQEIWKK